jgi:hypothetical protein
MSLPKHLVRPPRPVIKFKRIIFQWILYFSLKHYSCAKWHFLYSFVNLGARKRSSVQHLPISENNILCATVVSPIRGTWPPTVHSNKVLLPNHHVPRCNTILSPPTSFPCFQTLWFRTLTLFSQGMGSGFITTQNKLSNYYFIPNLPEYAS